MATTRVRHFPDLAIAVEMAKKIDKMACACYPIYAVTSGRSMALRWYVLL
ncbi:MAG TPA: hypothetical protein VKR42_00620 [Ktedonobacteraceae bacterium]|nr:hypothetical protein [Ktedonobacteraceae bacterium]